MIQSGAKGDVLPREVRTWNCVPCGAVNAEEHVYCPLCLVSRPLDKKGIPQIFSGQVFHFNGIIPRTFRHPSHSVEWRIVERYGASVSNSLDIATVTALIYRPGYERSDKVKLVVEKYSATIPALPISWVLDSVLQSRQIHPALYRLKLIPAVALPTVKGNILPHHQHPFFMIHADEYALFPIPKADDGAGNGCLVLKSKAAEGQVEPPPKPRTIAPFQWERVDILTAAAQATSSRNITDNSGDEGEGFDGRTECLSKGVDFLKRNKSKVNPKLFQGVIFALTESLEDNKTVVTALQAFGGRVVKLDKTNVCRSLKECLVTHLIFNKADKKGQYMIDASVVAGERNCPIFCDVLWVEDCLLLDEIIPAVDPYIATEKLLQTLGKKRMKRQ
eukprot:Tbor_TRINITY_DN2358_c0_g1::TRINITY_DN2358_c0_g1_i2::g.94::m.94